MQGGRHSIAQPCPTVLSPLQHGEGRLQAEGPQGRAHCSPGMGWERWQLTPPPLCSPCCSRAAAGMRLLKHKKDIKIELTGKLLNRSKLGA